MFRKRNNQSHRLELPLVPLRELVVFPHMVTPFFAGREGTVQAINEAMALPYLYESVTISQHFHQKDQHTHGLWAQVPETTASGTLRRRIRLRPEQMCQHRIYSVQHLDPVTVGGGRNRNMRHQYCWSRSIESKNWANPELNPRWFRHLWNGTRHPMSSRRLRHA